MALTLRSSSHPDLTDIDFAMMRRAIELAETAARQGEVPVGAVVYRTLDDGQVEIVAEAYNNREQTNDPTGHAELVAVAKAGRKLDEWRLSDCSLAVTLEPCPMCAGAIVNARVGRVIYGATDPKAGAVETLYAIATDPRLNHAATVIGGVYAEQCGQLLTSFFKERRKAKQKARRKAAG